MYRTIRSKSAGVADNNVRYISMLKHVLCHMQCFYQYFILRCAFFINDYSLIDMSGDYFASFFLKTYVYVYMGVWVV